MIAAGIVAGGTGVGVGPGLTSAMFGLDMITSNIGGKGIIDIFLTGALKTAFELWGKDTRQTDAAIKALVGDDNAEILVIGTAGENCVRYACIMAGIDHSAGHTGMGAVMGSKLLKAISVSCETRAEKTPPEEMPAVREYVKSIRDSVSRFRDYSQLGSSGGNGQSCRPTTQNSYIEIVICHQFLLLITTPPPSPSPFRGGG